MFCLVWKKLLDIDVCVLYIVLCDPHVWVNFFFLTINHKHEVTLMDNLLLESEVPIGHLTVEELDLGFNGDETVAFFGLIFYDCTRPGWPEVNRFVVYTDPEARYGCRVGCGGCGMNLLTSGRSYSAKMYELVVHQAANIMHELDVDIDHRKRMRKCQLSDFVLYENF